MEIKLSRYNPRQDKADLEAIVADFQYRLDQLGEKVDLDKFSKEIDQRSKSLINRNSIVLAKDGDVLVGAGFFTIWTDFLGNQHCLIHDVVTRKENAFKNGIEEAVLRELFNYLKKTMKIDKIGLWARKRDSNFQSVLMKLKIKKNTDLDYYEHQI